jgi:transposase
VTSTSARFSGKPSKKLTSRLPEAYTTIAIDQTRKSVGCDLYRAWFPEGERIPLPYWTESEAIKLLGAVSEDGETVFTEVNGRFTSDVTIHFLKALQDELGEHLHIVLDNAAYFASNQVAEFIAESSLKVTYLPPGSPDMNPMEECWRQFKRRLGNRFFTSVEELRAETLTALDDITPPQLVDYFCPSV